MPLAVLGGRFCGGGGEEREDAAAEFLGFKTVGGGVESAGDDPELFAAASGGVNHFRMAAGKRDIFFIANEENGKSAGSDSFHRRDFRDGKASEFFVAIEQRPGAGSEKSFAQPRIFSQTGIVVGRFADAGEGSFGDDGFDARISGGGLQDDAVAGAQQEFRLTDDSNAVVGDAVEEEDPTAIGIFRADFPAAERRSIGSLHVEVLASSAGGGEARVGFADEIGRQLAADGMEEGRGGKPSGYGSQERREEQQNQSDTN